jgi:hypothetical protein
MTKLILVFLVMIVGATETLAVDAADFYHCREMSYKDFAKQSLQWRGKQVVAFASWCSSCKSNVLDAKKKPNEFILVAAFDDREAAENVLKKWSIQAPCFMGEDLVDGLGISSLPWSKKL